MVGDLMLLVHDSNEGGKVGNAAPRARDQRPGDLAVAMSETNVEIVKGIFEAWSRGDFTSADWAHPAIEFSIPGPDPYVHHGIESAARAWAEFLEVFEDLSIVGESFHAAGDKVVVEQTFRGKGKGSGIPIDETPGAAVLTLRNGKVIRFQGFVTLDEALASAGLDK
jgi:ketosteroid isomerase-like protein